MIPPRPAEAATRQANRAVRDTLLFADVSDFEDVRRGFVGAIAQGVIRSASGSAVWNIPAWGFLDNPALEDDPPDTVNPSLWRMARLNFNHGLYRVAERVYQVRGYDIANMTIVEGDHGSIVIDPLTVAESASAALALYHAHRPERSVVAVIYSHSHVDHYGGVKGVMNDEEAGSGKVTVIAPDGFMEAVAGENVLVGNPMTRRAQYQFGTLLPPGPRGHVDAGLGKSIARGRVGLIAPNLLICEPLEAHVIDGVEIVFQLAPGTEAPAEMHMMMPGLGVLNMAENATRHLHNFCPMRGAVVRDPRLWSHYIDQAIELFGGQVDVLIGQHHWPTWGRDKVLGFLAQQRDLYKFIHDQTVRLMNHGLKPAEIAEVLELPASLSHWSLRGYYGTVSHNSKAVYQRYLSWYDGNPANLNPLPPEDNARKMVEYMGGAEALLTRARQDFALGQYRWVAQVANQLVFAQPDNRDARELAADAFEQLGYQAEAATWRNAYLFGAQELREGVTELPARPMISPELLGAVSTATLFDFIAVRLNPDRVGDHAFELAWEFTDSAERIALTLAHGTLTQLTGKVPANAQASIRTSKPVLIALVLGRRSVQAAIDADEMQVTGDATLPVVLFAMLDSFSMQFPMVEPVKTNHR